MPVDALIVITIQKMFTGSVLGIWLDVFLARVLIFAYLPLMAWLWVYGNSREKHAVKEAMWSVGVAIFLGEALSFIFLRLRPFLAVPNILALIPPPLTNSFPSIHTSIAVAVTAALYAVNKKWGLACLLMVLGIAIGRMGAGVHYPTDILGGMLVGLVSFVLVRLGHKALRQRSVA
ncbi:MAG: phosphatase PAP2 family protein [Patescibacteria group bacterium]|nr:phosphatase PAP2 family protein [Patescibacteria group bacterium]